ncbi:MAG: thermonuclease family protein [Bacteroidetes bacterium]|nr:thermonuclease family protein [Bacteroidota bacterium]
MEKLKLFTYKAKVLSVYDGDTITVDIDLGLSVFASGEKIRLHRINAPEVRGKSKKSGLKSRNYLRKLLLEKEIYLETIKDRKEKFGRYLGEIFIKEKEKFVNVNDLLVKKGFANYKKY